MSESAVGGAYWLLCGSVVVSTLLLIIFLITRDEDVPKLIIWSKIRADQVIFKGSDWGKYQYHNDNITTKMSML